MSDRPVLTPNADHPIVITPTEGHVVVRIDGQVVAETDDALTLTESTYPGVQYVALDAVDPAVLTRSDTTTFCPFKGEASYYHVTVGDRTVDDAIWTYEHPYPAVTTIEGRVAFYADKAEILVT